MTNEPNNTLMTEIEVLPGIPMDFPSTIITAVPLEATTINEKPKPRVRREKLFTRPDKISDILSKDQNKLIHLDPVPIFNERSEIKPWLQKIFFPQGIDIVIQRSDQSKVIFKCKATSSTSKCMGNINTNACPFRIRSSYSLKLKKWNIVIVNNSHSHQCQFNPESDEYKKFKNHLVQQNDITTIKQFEELEYKTKFKLPILPKVISCDCGLTNEVDWFNVVLPTTRIMGAKKVFKKTANNNNTNTNTSTIQSNNLLKKGNEKKFDNLTNFLDLSNNYMFSTQITNTTSLDEIDFTNMFNTKNDNINNEDLYLQNQMLDEINLNNIITTPNNDLNNLIDPINLDIFKTEYSTNLDNIFGDLTEPIDSASNLMLPGNNTVPSATEATTIDTNSETPDFLYTDFLSSDIVGLAYNDNIFINNNVKNVNVKDESASPQSWFDQLL